MYYFLIASVIFAIFKKVFLLKMIQYNFCAFNNLWFKRDKIIAKINGYTVRWFSLVLQSYWFWIIVYFYEPIIKCLKQKCWFCLLVNDMLRKLKKLNTGRQSCGYTSISLSILFVGINVREFHKANTVSKICKFNENSSTKELITSISIWFRWLVNYKILKILCF